MSIQAVAFITIPPVGKGLRDETILKKEISFTRLEKIHYSLSKSFYHDSPFLSRIKLGFDKRALHRVKKRQNSHNRKFCIHLKRIAPLAGRFSNSIGHTVKGVGGTIHGD
jgi:hypothetical protein